MAFCVKPPDWGFCAGDESVNPIPVTLTTSGSYSHQTTVGDTETTSASFSYQTGLKDVWSASGKVSFSWAHQEVTVNTETQGNTTTVHVHH